MKNFASLVSPLIRAAQEKYITWTQECQVAYELVLNLLTNEPILILPRFNQPFVFETDACNYGVGAVLAQLRDAYWHPVAYFSKHLSKQERYYSTSEKELFAIVLAMEHRQFLYGVQFVVITDHQPLKYLLTIIEPASRLLRWFNRLNMFSITIQYRKGIKNGT